MGRVFIQGAPETKGGEGVKRYYCRCCATVLTNVENLISKRFHSRSGKAYLFNQVVNIHEGRGEERAMTTGLHVVADVHCTVCWTNCGWKYLKAMEAEQRYKEGCFILERSKLVDSAQGSLAARASPPRPDALDWTSQSSSDSESDT